MNQKGMLLIDALISLAILTGIIMTAVFVLSIQQNSINNITYRLKALSYAQGVLAVVEQTSFDSIVAESYEYDNFIIEKTRVYESPYRIRIEVSVSWGEEVNQSVVLSTWKINDAMLLDTPDCGVLHQSWSSVNAVIHDDIAFSQMDVTDALLYKNYIYIATDSTRVSDPDLYVIDITNEVHPQIVGAYNTGPGIAQVSRVGEYLYVANRGVQQFQILSLVAPQVPTLITQISLPGVTASGGAGIGHSIIAINSSVYIGLTKAEGPELIVLDVTQSQQPIVRSSYEINSRVNDIFVSDNFLAIATASDQNLQLFTHDLDFVGTYSFTNEQQSGQKVFILGSDIFLGRSTVSIGTRSPELVWINEADEEQEIDINGSVDALQVTDKNIFITQYKHGESVLKVIDRERGAEYTESIAGRGVQVLCTENYLYVITNNYLNSIQLFTPYE